MRQLYLYLFISLPFLGFTQSGFSGGISFITEYSHSTFDTKGMNGFVNTFNDFWGDKLSEPYSEFNGHELSHPNFGLGFRVISQGEVGFVASTSFLYGRKKSYTHSAIWSNGVENELDFKARDLQWTVTTGMHWENLVYLEAYCGANARKLEMTHATIYQDGSKSLSSEYKLNGLYSGKIASFDVGFQAGLRLGLFYLYCKPTWALKNYLPGKGLISIADFTTVNYPPSDFPSDYRTYATDPLSFLEQDLGVKTDDFEGFRLNIGVELILGAK